MTIVSYIIRNGWPGQITRSLSTSSSKPAWRRASDRTRTLDQLDAVGPPEVGHHSTTPSSKAIPTSRRNGRRVPIHRETVQASRQPNDYASGSLFRALQLAASAGIGPRLFKGPHEPLLSEVARSERGKIPRSRVKTVLDLIPLALRQQQDESLHTKLEVLFSRWVLKVVQQAETGTYHERTGAVSDPGPELIHKLRDVGVWRLHDRLCVRALLAESSFSAAKLVSGLESAGSISNDDRSDLVSLLIIRHILSRHIVSRRALQLLLDEVIRITTRATTYDKGSAVRNGASGSASPSLSHFTGLYSNYLLFSRLIWHACLVWPEALDTVARSWTRSFDLLSDNLPQMDDRAASWYTTFTSTLYNSLLFQLAKRHAAEPFKFAAHQEAAQAHLLQHMASGRSPLDLDRAGYRGVLLVQLAHRKTEDEQAWAELKSPAWPPWKESRTAMDALIDPEIHGVSRARKILQRSREAGFSSDDFEATAEIYTGWDTDQSPTIQTRTITPGFKRTTNDADTWAARIRCTRTVREAWACFLAYEDTLQMPDQEVYFAMYEKLHYETRLPDDRTASKEVPESPRTFAGDSKEVSPSPASAHHETYTRTIPLTPEQFFRHMKKQRLKPTGRILAFFIANAPTWQTGWMIARLGLGSLLKTWPMQPHQGPQGPDPLSYMAAFLRFWIRHPLEVRASHLLDRFRLQHLVVNDWKLDAKQPVVIGYNLLLQHRPRYHLAWNTLLEPLASMRRVRVLDLGSNGLQVMQQAHKSEAVGHMESLVAVSMAKQLCLALGSMDMDLDAVGLGYFCTIVSRAASAGTEIQSLCVHHLDNGEPSLDRPLFPQNDKKVAQVTKQLDHIGHFINESFMRLVAGQSDGSIPKQTEASNDTSITSADDFALPRLLFVPGPSLLHSYMRALGSLGKHKTMLQLFQWMKVHWPELRDRRAEQPSGPAMFRKMLVSARMFLQLGYDGSRKGLNDKFFADVEREENGSSDDGDEWTWAASKKTVGQIREIVESMEDEWGPWPSSMDVLEYVERGKRPTK